MPEDNQLNSQTLSVQLEVGRTLVPVQGCNLIHTVGELPQAEILLQIDSRDAVSEVGINTEIYRRLSQLFQEKIQNKTSLEPDSRLTITDTSGFRLVFNGYLGQPEVAFQSGRAIIRVSMVHAKAGVQAWNGKIYHYVQPYAYPGLFEAFSDSASPDAQAAFKSTSIAQHMQALLEFAMNSAVMVSSFDDTTSYDLLPIHNMNKKAMPMVMDVLKASRETTRIDGLQADAFAPDNMHDRIFEVLRGSPNFWVALQHISRMFMFQVNADWKGNLWLEKIPYLSDPGDRVISVPVADLTFRSSHLYELPVLQVLVVGSDINQYVFSGQLGADQGARPLVPVPVDGSEHYAGRIAAEGDTWSRMFSLARYPEHVDRDAAGMFYVLQVPNWINDDLLAYETLEELRETAEKQSSTMDRNQQLVAIMPELRSAIQKQNTPRLKILQYMARMFFEELYLGATYATVTVPFDARPCAGRTYKVQDFAGNPLFSGYLRSVNHSVSIVPPGAVASTTLVFSHILVSGARLNILDDRSKSPAAKNLGDYGDSTYDPAGAGAN
jgi:hypothetical protein